MPALDQVRVVFRNFSNVYNETFAKIVSNVNLKTLTNLEKGSNLDAVPECTFASEYSTAVKDGIILINSFHLILRSVHCLRKSRPLRQPSKYIESGILRIVCTEIFLQIIIKSFVTEFIFSGI